MLVPTMALHADNLHFLSVTQAGAGQSLLFEAKIGLIKADFTPSPTLALTDLTEADYDGYAQQAAAPYTLPFVGEGGLELIRATLFHAQMTGDTHPNTIFGAFLVDTGGTILLASEKFDQPIALVTTANAFDYLLTFGMDPSGNYGLGLVG